MPLLHPTPGSVLNQFRTLRPDVYHSLAFPFYHPVAGKTATFVSDGESVMLWTMRRLPGYRDWVIHSGPQGFEPPEWMRLYMGGASFPAPPVPPGKKPAVRAVIAGNIAWLPRRVLAALASLDTCWLGLSAGRARPENGLLTAVSVVWSLGSIKGHGVIICQDPS
ncbi:MAG: hypothetical protein V4726_01005 [Verrucomicrobiota bacterium]